MNSAVYVCSRVLHVLADHGDAPRWLVAINSRRVPARSIWLSSVAGMIGLDTDVLDAIGYSASKGAIITLTRDLAVKWAPRGIRVNAIAPGFFDTRLSHALLQKTQQKIEKTTPMGRIGKPGELAGVAVFLASAAASYVTGQVLAVDGGMTA